jgi:hypothetical protein
MALFIVVVLAAAVVVTATVGLIIFCICKAKYQ